MDRLRALFSRQNMPKIMLLVGIYLLGRMEGEGRFRWSDIFATTWTTVTSIASAAADSAKGVAGL